ncbi:MAG: cell division FtsZ family protein [Deltaproteobacteria bacterium]|jgi:cell division protein FtsZ|nr:cell division FtsZ family protein [Deltaproteobacteria bacterium]
MDNDNFTANPPDSLVLPDCGLEFVDDCPMLHHKIMVMGLGGCGNNAINHMVRSGLKGPVFIAANSDLQDLRRCLAKTKVQLGVKLSGGHGCGGNPITGQRCAEENLDDLMKPLKGSDMTFLMAGMGGGTGSGAIPVVAESLSKLEKPPLVVAVVTRPFPWEDYRVALADQVIARLRRFCNSVIIIPNAKICDLHPDMEFLEAKSRVDDVLLRAVSSITYLIEKAGEINLDFADISKVMTKKGSAIMGYGEASGEKRAQLALEAAITNPLMSDVSLKGARGVLVNITCDRRIKTNEIQIINKLVHTEIGPGVEFFSGLVFDDSLAASGVLKVTVVATGLDQVDDDLGEEPVSPHVGATVAPKMETKTEMKAEAEAEVEVDLDMDVDLDDLDALDSLDDPDLVILEPAVEEAAVAASKLPGPRVSETRITAAARPESRFGALGSGPLAPVAPRPVAFNRSAPLSPVETLVTPPSPNQLGHRSRNKYEENRGVDPAYTQGEFYDLPPHFRRK